MALFVVAGNLAIVVLRWHTLTMNTTSTAQSPLTEGNRPLADLPPLPSLCRAGAQRPVPNDAACFALWDKYAMLPNIRRHSLLVAHVATVLAQRAVGSVPADPDMAMRAGIHLSTSVAYRVTSSPSLANSR